MAFDDLYRLSAHAVIANSDGLILQLKATYGACGWGLPRGALEPGETIHECLLRECREELGCEVAIRALTGVYHHRAVNSHAFIFRCDLDNSAAICLSEEHSEFRFFALDELSAVQRQRVVDCLGYRGAAVSARF